MAASKHFEVDVTVRMRVSGPVTYAGAVALATQSVKLVPVHARDPEAFVSDMTITKVGIDGPMGEDRGV